MALNPYLQRARDIFAREGAGVLARRMGLKIRSALGMGGRGDFDHGYGAWIEKFDQPLSSAEAEAVYQALGAKPLITVIMPVFNVDPQWLRGAIESVREQSYPHWQLCIVDDASTDPRISETLDIYRHSDPRIRIARNQDNLGISETSNHALRLAEGEFIGLLDHDDLLARDALLHNARVIDRESDVDLVYSDEDKINPGGKRNTPFFKPDFSPELLLGQNYIGHFVVARRSLVNEIGGFRKGLDGAQDYDLLLRLISKSPRVQHIPKILYHWREIPGSTATTFNSKSYAGDAGKKALQNFAQENQLNATVTNGTQPGTYFTRFAVNDSPLVSIILPFRDQADLLDKCLGSIFARTDWQRLEIIALDNQSEQPATRNIIHKWRDSGKPVRFVAYDAPFNYSRICNTGVAEAIGDYIVLLNSDIEITSDHWIETLLGHARQPATGAVGAKLLYPGQTIQHAGIVVGIDGGAGHPYKHFPADHRGYFLRLGLAHNVSALTGALMMVRKARFLEVGGLDQEMFAVAYNDVDLCLKLMQAGYRNILNPHCTAIHRESSSRGYEYSAQQQSRHDREKGLMREKWLDFYTRGDPFYNPNLTLAREDYSLNFQRQDPFTIPSGV
jgi:GT2 family glycosyltransferase